MGCQLRFLLTLRIWTSIRKCIHCTKIYCTCDVNVLLKCDSKPLSIFFRERECDRIRFSFESGISYIRFLNIFVITFVIMKLQLKYKTALTLKAVANKLSQVIFIYTELYYITVFIRLRRSNPLRLLFCNNMLGQTKILKVILICGLIWGASLVSWIQPRIYHISHLV